MATSSRFSTLHGHDVAAADCGCVRLRIRSQIGVPIQNSNSIGINNRWASTLSVLALGWASPMTWKSRHHLPRREAKSPRRRSGVSSNSVFLYFEKYATRVAPKSAFHSGR